MVWAVRKLGLVIGLFFMAVAIPVAFLTPILPIGLPMFGVGLILVLNTSATAKRVFVRWSRRYPGTAQPIRRFLKRRRKRTGDMSEGNVTDGL